MKVGSAITYPFKKTNFWPCVGIPGLVQATVVAFMLIIMVIVAIVGSIMGANDQNMSMIILAVSVPLALILFIVLAPINGYLWALTHTWATEGFEAASPQWKGRWREYTIAGLHSIGLSLILIIPAFLAIISLGLLVPFLVTPYVLASEQRTIGAYFSKLNEGITLTLQYYGKLLVAVYLMIPLAMMYAIFQFGLCMTVIGYLFANITGVLMTAAFINLYLQQLGVPEIISESGTTDEF